MPYRCSNLSDTHTNNGGNKCAENSCPARELHKKLEGCLGDNATNPNEHVSCIALN